MTTEELERLIRTAGLTPTQEMIELAKAVYNLGFDNGYFGSIHD